MRINHKANKGSLIAQLLLFSLLLCSRAYAQNNDSRFQRDFLKKFYYPEILKSSCTATFANLLIDVSDDGTIESFSVSDSAPQLFKDEFNRIKGTLNVDFIKSLIIEKNLKSSAIIIPLFYVYNSDYCVNSFEQVGYLEKNYYKFDGKPLQKPVYNLNPIIGLMYKPMR